jgi:hypothetical protein
MARDKSKKGVRKQPSQFIDWVSENYGPETAKWYKIYTGKGKAEASKQRINLSAMLGEIGAYHEGHGFAAKDIHPYHGGGPTVSQNLAPELGIQNVAHGELPRIPKEDMMRLGIPSTWLEHLFEADLEFHGHKVIGNPDRQAWLDMDRGMPPEQAAAQSRMRDDLRAQGVEFKVDGDTIPDERITTVEGMKGPNWSATKQPEAPKLDYTDIKTTGEVKVTSPKRGRKVPTQHVRIAKGVARWIPGPLDDVALGTGFGGVAAVAALATGGNPAQAFGDVVSDVAVGDLQGGELFDESQDFGEVLQQSREQNVRPLMDRLNEGVLGDVGRAVKRGGSFKIDAGVVKFTAPEFGFSELLGFN